jgi:hypothetical protein
MRKTEKSMRIKIYEKYCITTKKGKNYYRLTRETPTHIIKGY